MNYVFFISLIHNSYFMIHYEMQDPSRIQSKHLSTQKEVEYRNELNDFFAKSHGSFTEKLQNFPKYVPRQALAKFLFRYEVFKKILNVHGSILECGVYLGGGLMSFAQLSTIFEPYNYQRKIIGFDTFTGFSSVSKEDKKGRSEHLKKGGYEIDAKEYEELKKCIDLFDSNRFLKHLQKVDLIRGDVSKTLPKYIKENPHIIVSLLCLDMDVFAPTRNALKVVLPRMPKGAVIIFDELNSDTWPGETEAVLKTIGIKNLRLQRFPFDPMRSYAVID